jgi:hypothetical protein
MSFPAATRVSARMSSPELSRCPSTVPMSVTVRPPTVTVAANSRQPPAWLVEPVLMPITPYRPSSVL